MNKKSLLQSLKVIILGALLSIGIAFAQTWTPPSSTPPVPNADAPINVGGTKQIKAGPLVIGTNYLNALKGGGSADFSGYDLKTSVGIFKDIVTDDLSSNTIGTYQATVGALGHSASIPQPVCADKGGKLVLCGAPPPTVTCGSADGETFTTAPTTNLCSDGSTPTVSGGANGPWSWTCGAASCSATKTVAPTGVVKYDSGSVCGSIEHWSVPSGVTKIKVLAVGAGGGGGDGSGIYGSGGGGAGGGGYIYVKDVPVQVNDDITSFVGCPNSGDSWVKKNGSTIVVADGGNSGASGYNSATSKIDGKGGAGGSNSFFSLGTLVVKGNGGKGGDGYLATGMTGGGGGGGGGGCGGSSSDGVSGSGYVAGTHGAFYTIVATPQWVFCNQGGDGGNGGVAGSSDSKNGKSTYGASAPGGGAGGGGAGYGINHSGGSGSAGARGAVYLWY